MYGYGCANHGTLVSVRLKNSIRFYLATTLGAACPNVGEVHWTMAKLPKVVPGRSLPGHNSLRHPDERWEIGGVVVEPILLG